MLKLETVQPTGSFKVRGALVAVAAALQEGPDRPVVTASAGNHGLGVAWAARALGARATVVIPGNASETKRAGLEQFGVEVVVHGDSYDDAEARALTLASESGARFVSAYNDGDVIAGQGTIALELFDQVPDLTTIVAPVGGGGLLAGLGLAAATRPGVAVCGVEAAASPAMSTSVAAGHPVAVPIGATLADGLAGNIEPGAVTVAMVARDAEQIVGVDEESIRQRCPVPGLRPRSRGRAVGGGGRGRPAGRRHGTGMGDDGSRGDRPQCHPLPSRRPPVR